MNNKLSIQDLASVLAEKSGMDMKTASAFIKTVFEIVEEYIAIDKIVKIKGFGTFKLINVSDRESVNVNTGERIVIAGHTKLSFTPDAVLKETVNRPFADFETTLLNESTSIEEMERIPEQYNEQSLSDAGLEETPEIAIEATADTDDNGELKEESQEITEETESPDVAQTEEEVNVTATDENQVVSQPDSIAVETVESRVDSHINEENPSYPMASDSVLSLESDSKGATHKWLYVISTILLMALSYAAGHYQVLSGFDIALYPEHLDEGTAAKEVGQPAPLEMQAPAECIDTLLTDTLTTDSVETATDTIAKPEPVVKEEDPAEIAKYFPQVPGGEYWIVGDAGRVHYMKVGETLYKIAKQELGDRELVRYLIVFNDFEDPNIIHTGDKIRIPKLVKKTPVNR